MSNSTSSAAAAEASSSSDLPPCGRTCLANVIQDQLTQRGCDPGNNTCYCENADFGYAIRDCVFEGCETNAAQQQTISYAVDFCEEALYGDGQSGSDSSSSSGISSSSSTGTTTTSNPSSSTSTTATPSEQTAGVPRPTPGPDITTGAKAGIGVGVTLGVIAVIGVIFLLWRRRKKSKVTGPGETVDTSEQGAGLKHEKYGEPIHEKDSRGVKSELYTKDNVHEMQQPPVELSAGEQPSRTAEAAVTSNG